MKRIVLFLALFMSFHLSHNQCGNSGFFYLIDCTVMATNGNAVGKVAEGWSNTATEIATALSLIEQKKFVHLSPGAFALLTRPCDNKSDYQSILDGIAKTSVRNATEDNFKVLTQFDVRLSCSMNSTLIS